MTFSGLPSLRDPKHSLKNSASSASSSPSSSPASSPTSTKPVFNQHQQQSLQQQLQQQHRSGAVLDTDRPTDNVTPPLSTTTSMGETRPDSTESGTVMSVATAANVSAETVTSTNLTENSFLGLIQTSFGHVLSALSPPHSQGMRSPPPPPVESSTMLDLHHLQVQSTSPAVAPAVAPAPPGPLTSMTTIDLPTHSPIIAAYRKRLNVNQVCDWCRYRKIRCDRESPCNSCQHSKRECIRTPPSALLANQQTSGTGDEQEPSVSSPASSTGKTKRIRAINKDGRSRRASKSYRGSSISSHHSSSYTSFSSDNDGSDENEEVGNDEIKSISGFRAGQTSPVSPVIGSLTLAGLGLSGLGLGLGGIGSNRDLEARRGSDIRMMSPPSFGSSTVSFQNSAISQQIGLQDQEHLDRMHRIEMLLANVIPGAAEFIASGSHSSLPLQQQHQQQYQQLEHWASVVEKKKLFSLTHNLDKDEQRSLQDRLLSPREDLANILPSSPAVSSTMALPWSGSPSVLSSLQEDNGPIDTLSSSLSLLPVTSGPDYIERMKRIEVLLGTIQDGPLAEALISQSQGQSPSDVSSRGNSVDVTDLSKPSKKLLKKEHKKQSKADGRKSNYSNDGTIVKRPHVAAGFAGQKPPPKLPQAIAEAAQKKQAIRKKRVSAAAAAKAAAATNSGIIGSVLSANNTSTLLLSASMPLNGDSLRTVQGSDGIKMDSRMMAISTTASFEIPSNYDNESSTPSFPHQQQRQQPQQQQQQQGQHQLQLTQHHNSISLQTQTQVFSPYQHLQHQEQQQQQISIPAVNSMSIPNADSITSYGSLVVPASSSTSSSPSSSPSLSRATAVMAQDNMAMSSISSMSSGHQHQQHQHISFSQTQLSGNFEMGGSDARHSGMSTSSDTVGPQDANDTHIHPFAHPGQQQHKQQQQQAQQHHGHHHQSINISQENFANFGLNMDESLEGLMKTSIGSFDRLMESFSSESSSLMDHQHHHQQQQKQRQQFTPSTPAAADQFSYFQTLQQTPIPQQHFQQQQSYFQQQGQQGQQQQQSQQGHVNLQEMSRTMWMPNYSGSASFPVPANPEFSWPSSPQTHHQQSQTLSRQQGTMQSINISANDSSQEEMEQDLGSLESHQNSQQQQQQQQLSAHALFQQQHQEQQRRHTEQQQQQQQQQRQLLLQHRASIQHQHQQTLYIPLMKDDEDEENENEDVESVHLPNHV
ncbi:hypothetical protein BGZ95_002973 [Linnemannia exigua]|uniref:Zn(2)-C6 fungal-type domain-containing protein n=1 Tax=Linnemannia exigua TaxID=604196 RepID=A0AAD4D4U4_9FUNG|nr:hypothetical protein BGZ95_002973 [Linnemannia exigua]